MHGTEAPPTKNPWRRWVQFWFRPADPTTMGFIRLVTGLLAVYVHLAYSFDLHAFFGPNAWYGLTEVNQERKGVPHLIPPAGWEETRRTARVPDFPHRRTAVLRYLRDVGSKPAGEVEPQLKWMDRLNQSNNGLLFATGMGYVLELAPDPADRALQLDVLRDESKRSAASMAIRPPNKIMATPLAVLGLPPAELGVVAGEIEACYRGLPAAPLDREYVVNHLRELDPASRLATVELLHRLPTLPADQREAELIYLEHWGLESRLAARVGNPTFSLWFHVTDPAGMAVAHGVMVVIFVLFAIGLWTRVTSVLAWLAAITYIHRTQQVLFGMDTMLNILLFYLMFADSGAALSVDRLVKRYRAAKLSLQRTGGIDAPTAAYLRQPPASVASGFAQRLIQVHFCFIYMASGLSKLKGPAWWDHRAYWDTLANPEFTLIHHHWYEWLVRELASNRPVFALMSAVGIAVTFLAEIGLPFLIWTRRRPYMMVLGMCLHAGIAVFMGLWIFSLLMMAMLLAYLPGAAMRNRLFGDPGPAKLRLKLPGRGDRAVRAGAVVAAVDFDAAVEVTDSGRGDAVSVEKDGQTLTGPAAPAAVLAALPWLAPLRWLPGVRGLFDLRLPAVPAPARR